MDTMQINDGRKFTFAEKEEGDRVDMPPTQQKKRIESIVYYIYHEGINRYIHNVHHVFRYQFWHNYRIIY